MVEKNRRNTQNAQHRQALKPRLSKSTARVTFKRVQVLAASVRTKWPRNENPRIFDTTETEWNALKEVPCKREIQFERLLPDGKWEKQKSAWRVIVNGDVRFYKQTAEEKHDSLVLGDQAKQNRSSEQEVGRGKNLIQSAKYPEC